MSNAQSQMTSSVEKLTYASCRVFSVSLSHKQIVLSRLHKRSKIRESNFVDSAGLHKMMIGVLRQRITQDSELLGLNL